MEQLVTAGFQHQQVLKINSSKGNSLFNIERTSTKKGKNISKLSLKYLCSPPSSQVLVTQHTATVSHDVANHQ